MTVAYDGEAWTSAANIFAKGTAIRRTLRSELFYISLIAYGVILAINWNVHPATASEVVRPLGYVVGLLGALFTYQICCFNGHCYKKHNENWAAAHFFRREALRYCGIFCCILCPPRGAGALMFF